MKWLKSDYLKLTVVILLAVIIFYCLYATFNKGSSKAQEEEEVRELFQDLANEEEQPLANDNSMVKLAPEPSQPLGNNEDFKRYNNTASDGNQAPKDCYPRDQLAPSELLPGDSNSKWAQVNPSGQGDLKDQNFLNAGHHLGVNTVGQTLRNANLQLRSDPPNPQVSVGPWMQTTIEADTNRKPFEIGGN